MKKSKKEEVKILNKEVNIYRIIIIVLIAVLAYVGVIFTDYKRVVSGNAPLLVLKTNKYEDGGSIEYFCLGYKIIAYNTLSGNESIEVGSIFKKFDESSEYKSSGRVEVDEFISIRGKINNIYNSDSGRSLIKVEGELYADTLYDCASVTIMDTTVIKDKNNETISIRDLKEGMTVEVVFDGEVAESYPVQAVAKVVKIK